jgi:hypothetical protein
MSFTAPLWNELVFEKINELQLSQQEMFKHIANLSHRMTHLENRLTNISSGLSLVLTHLHRESKESKESNMNIINRPNSLAAPTMSSSSSSTTPTLPQTVTANPHTDTNLAHLVLQRSNSHPSMFNNNINIQNSNNHLQSNTSTTTHHQSPIPVNFTNTPYIANVINTPNVTNVTSVPAQHVLTTTTKDTTPVSDVDIKKYIDDPEEGEWTKVSRRRK